MGGGCLTRGEKNFHFFRFMICWFNRPNFGPETGGRAVYHVVVGVSDFGPNQRGVYQVECLV